MFPIKEIPAKFRSVARGTLVIEMIRPARLGCSQTVIPAGAIGFVMGALDDKLAVAFPWINEHGVVPRTAVKPLGRQPR